MPIVFSPFLFLDFLLRRWRWLSFDGSNKNAMAWLDANPGDGAPVNRHWPER
jgi:hypothetical protein